MTWLQQGVSLLVNMMPSCNLAACVARWETHDQTGLAHCNAATSHHEFEVRAGLPTSLHKHASCMLACYQESSQDCVRVCSVVC